MTIRTFWTIFIKILGLWLVMGSLTVIPQFFLTVFSTSTDPIEPQPNFLSTVALLLFTIIIYVFILQLFIFKTAWLIDQLHLDKGFKEEEINLNVQLSTVLTVTTIVIGGIIFVDSLPEFCRQLFVFFQQKNMFKDSPVSGWIIFYFVKTILGYLLMIYSKEVVAFIGKNSKTK